MLFYRIPTSTKRYWPQAHPEDEHTPSNALITQGRASAQFVGTLSWPRSQERQGLCTAILIELLSQLLELVTTSWLHMCLTTDSAAWRGTSICLKLHPAFWGAVRILQRLKKHTLTIPCKGWELVSPKLSVACSSLAKTDWRAPKYFCFLSLWSAQKYFQFLFLTHEKLTKSSFPEENTLKIS